MAVTEGIAEITEENYFKLALIYYEQAVSSNRGANDLLTLLFVLRLRKNKVPLESLVSNHSIEFILACENYKNTGHFHPPILKDGHADSLEGLNVLVKNGVYNLDADNNLGKKHPSIPQNKYCANTV